MCPDHQILSVYRDGELPSPWKEKMESHLSRCPQCRERLESYRLIFANATDPADAEPSAAVVAAAQDRVWRRLETASGGGRFAARSVSRRRGGIWRRSISLPLPAVAAAAVLLFVLAALWLRRPAVLPPDTAPEMTITADAEMDTPGIIPVADMDSVLQYLGNRDNGDILILRLPESRNFFSSGEPAIIKAADYSRNAPGRRQQ